MRTRLTLCRRFNSLHNVHPAEAFPLALACGVVLAQITFVAVQSTTLSSVLSKNCRLLAMVTYPGTLQLESSNAKIDRRSDFPHRQRYPRIRHRNGHPILQIRTFCAPRKMEYDIVHRRHRSFRRLDLDTDHRVAYVQQMLRQPDLVSNALRSLDTSSAYRSGVSSPIVGSCYQHSAHATRRC